MNTPRPAAEITTSSMADIAFLLLTFFLITAVIENQRGIPLILPQLSTVSSIPWKDRNLFTVQINSQNQFLIEGKPRPTLQGVRDEIKRFIINDKGDATLAENPKEALISLKADRGTKHAIFIAALDEIQAAYCEMYAQRANMSMKEFRNLNLKINKNKILHFKAKEGLPMNISIAEPTKVDHE